MTGGEVAIQPENLGALHIDTQRLTIRRLRYEDADAYLDIFTDQQTCDDDGGYEAFTGRDEKFERLIREFSEDPTRYVITLRETGRLIGVIHLMPPLTMRAVPSIEIGYCIHRDDRRRGYAFEAVTALLDVLHGELGFKLVLAGAFAFNQPSQRLLEKLGFSREGITRYDTNHRIHGLTDMVNYYHEA